MMKPKHKKYQLAQAYDKYNNSKNCSYRLLLHVEPTNSIDEQLSKSTNTGKVQNIFESNEAHRARKMDVKLDKDYEFVGFNELKNYKERIQKKKKTFNSNIKKQIEILSSRPSTLAKIDIGQHYLTKQEVVKQFSPHHRLEQSEITQKYRTNPLKTMNSNMDNSFSVDHLHTPNDRLSRKHSQKFSLTKLQEKMEQYKKNWNRQILKKTAAKNKRNKNVSKLSSVLQSIQEYRKITEERQKLSQREKLQHASPKLWDSILRSKQTLKTCQKRPIEHIDCNGFNTKGCSKLDKQILWIEQKNKQGFFFQVKRKRYEQ